MPLIKISENNFPDWSEIKKISLFDVDANRPVSVKTSFEKSAIFLINGICLIKIFDEEKTCAKESKIFLNNESIFIK